MTHADTILESLVTVCRDMDIISPNVTYSTIALDAEGEHSNVSPPIIEFTVDEIERTQNRNTEKVGVETDSDGNKIGYIFERWFDMSVVAEALVVTQTNETHRGLEQDLQDTMYIYDKYGMNRPLPDPDSTDNSVLTGVNWLILDETTPDNDFTMNPSIRTRNVRLEIGFSHEFRTSDLGIEYDRIENVDLTTNVTS